MAFVGAMTSSLCAARAAEVTITTGADVEPVAVAFHAHRVDRPGEAVEYLMQMPGLNVIELPDGLWELRLADHALWAPRIYIRNTDVSALRVWPAVPLRAVAKQLTALSVEFTSLDAAGAVGKAECHVTADSWMCAIPSGRYDLRFSSPQCAPEYRFDVTVSRNAEVLLQFVRGASLSGRLALVDESKISLEGVEVSLISAGAKRHITKSTASGFFQFKGLLPGDYSLRARRQGFVGQTRSVTVVAGAAAELDDPIFLDRPKQLTINLVPSLDSDSKPWHVALSSLDAEGRLTDVSESKATPDGLWSRPGLIAGRYRVYVRRANGQLWKWHDTTVTEDTTLPIMALGERIRGIVTLAARPLAAKLSFGGEGGITLLSGEDGRFEGYIPAQDGEEYTILVDAEPLPVIRTVRVKLERSEVGEPSIVIRLPATTLMGRVVGDDGSPKSNVIVTVSKPQQIHQVFTGDDGGFQLTGIDPGEYRVIAETRDGRSEPAQVRVGSDAPVEVELVLRGHVVVRGRVGAGDVPVVQADIYAIPRDTQWAPFMPQAKTTDRGRFQVELPPRTSVFDLLFVHAAFDVVLTRVTVQQDTSRHIVATQIGGTLSVESESSGDLVLRHAGGECWLNWLASLPGAGGAIDSGRVILPRLEPGEYSVCSVKTQQCAGGYLAPYGTLNVAVR